LGRVGAGGGAVKVAIVDLGTNTCRLFLAEVENGTVTPRERLTTVVRLGQGVDVSRRLHPEAVSRTRDCLRAYAPKVRDFAPERGLLIATSVLRDAVDGDQFLDIARCEIGLPSRVLAGAEEARLAFRGGTAGEAARLPGPLVLIDIGGGCTEFACGAAGLPPAFVCSCDIGAVRLTERFFAHDPPRAEEITALEVFVAETIVSAVPAKVRGGVHAAVGVAGTFATLVAYRLRLSVFDAERVHGYLLTLPEIDVAVAELSRLTSAERALLPGIQPGREDVILAGALIARAALRAFGLDTVRCSEADLLDGAALAVAEGSLGAA
jgi:exopolyphosphatase/guanosine-5'-triphosphate,3'-diphosphate pyrophosphatase